MGNKSVIRPIKIFLICLSILFTIISGIYFKYDIYNQISTVIWLSAIVFWVIINLTEAKLVINKKAIFMAGLLFIMALFIRLINLNYQPPGLWHDEIEANIAGQNWVRKFRLDKIFIPYTTDATGHPAVSMAISGISGLIMGNNSLGVRLPSALFGALSVVVFYMLLKLFFNNKTSFIGGLLMATSYWQIVLSRIGFEAAFFWFFQIWSAYWLSRYYKNSDFKSLGWLGISLGLGIYSYLAFRSWLIIMILFSVVVIWYKNRDNLAKAAVDGGYLLISLFLIYLPLFFYGRHYPDRIWARSADLSIFNQKFSDIDRPKMIFENSFKTISMLFWSGDPNLRHNPTQIPMLDPITGVLLLSAVIWLLKKGKILILITLLISSLVMAANGIFTYEPPYIIQPHSLRTLGMLPIIYITICLFTESIKKFKLVKLGVIGFIIIFNLNSYFKINKSINYREAYQTKQTEAALQLKKWCQMNPVISSDLISQVHIDFLAGGCKYRLDDNRSINLNDYYILSSRNNLTKLTDNYRIAIID